MRKLFRTLAFFASAILCTAAYLPSAQAQQQQPVRVAIVGLVHGHVHGFLQNLPKSQAAQLVAIVEPNKELAQKYATQYHLDPRLFYTDLEPTLQAQKPDAVLVYTTIADHRKVIEAAARHKISSMVEKPLATTMEDTYAIQRAAHDHNVHVLVNYETTWYSSNAEALREVRDTRLGTVRKVVVHDGHEGPKEIGVGPEWLPWLTDPVQNGAGALFDFGCYGADLMTVMMQGKAPLSVTAVTQTDKPNIYPHVEDDATVILRYPGAQAVLMPSWDWTFSRKDMEVYGTEGTLTTVGPDQVLTRYKHDSHPEQHAAGQLPLAQRNSLDYLAAVLHGQAQDRGDLSALDTNVVVMQILDAARRSAQTGRTVTLSPGH